MSCHSLEKTNGKYTNIYRNRTIVLLPQFILKKIIKLTPDMMVREQILSQKHTRLDARSQKDRWASQVRLKDRMSEFDDRSDTRFCPRHQLAELKSNVNMKNCKCLFHNVCIWSRFDPSRETGSRYLTSDQFRFLLFPCWRHRAHVVPRGGAWCLKTQVLSQDVLLKKYPLIV